MQYGDNRKQFIEVGESNIVKNLQTIDHAALCGYPDGIFELLHCAVYSAAQMFRAPRKRPALRPADMETAFKRRQEFRGQSRVHVVVGNSEWLSTCSVVACLHLWQLT